MNILSRDVEIKGTLVSGQDMVIEGKVEGNIDSRGKITIGQHAVIKGDIHSRQVTVFGSVEGSIMAKEKCELKSSATILGDVSASACLAEAGVAFKGKARVGNRKVPAK